MTPAKKLRIKKAFLAAIVQEWGANPPMVRVVEIAWRLSDADPVDDVRKYTDMAEAVRARYIEARASLRVWLARSLPRMSNALFDGRPDDVCLAIGMQETGSIRTARLTVRAREVDRRRDWNVCK